MKIQNRIMDDITINSEVEIESGEYREISISDTGVGMSEEICKRVFDPFLTTKGKRRAPAKAWRWSMALLSELASISSFFQKEGRERNSQYTFLVPRLQSRNWNSLLASL